MKRLAASALLGLAIAAGLAAPAAAQSLTPTLQFTHTDPVTFGESWHVSVVVEVSLDGFTIPLGPSAGTVAFHLDGDATPYASGLPLNADGHAYFAPRPDSPVAAGEHSIRSVFTPFNGQPLTTAEATLVFVITPLDAQAHLDVADVGIEDAVVRLSLTGSAVQTYGGGPAGVWQVTVSRDGDTVSTTELAQPHGGEPLSFELESLPAGAEITVTATYTPADVIAASITVQQPAELVVTTQSADFLGLLGTPVSVEPWQLVVGGLIAAVSAGLTAFFAVRLRRSRTGVVALDAAQPTDVA